LCSCRPISNHAPLIVSEMRYADRRMDAHVLPCSLISVRANKA
jgi:hypothetical protein